MRHEVHRRAVRIDGLDVQLSGVAPRVARRVAAALPSAVAAEIGRGDPPAGQGLTLAGGGAAEVTRALAREIAARIRAGLQAGTREDR